MVKIQYISHNEIDYSKWDDCISRSLNGIVYAYSWYLDIVAGKWDAIICDDYRIVFPLVYKKKYGIYYIYQPYFTQQLGAFSPNTIDKDTLLSILESIPSKFRYQEINLNLFNLLDSSKITVQNRVTYQLDLVQPYFDLSSKFNENTRRNISKSIAIGVKVRMKLAVDEFIEFQKRNLAVSIPTGEFEKLRMIIQYSVDHKLGKIYAAYSAQDNLCAAVFFVRINGKVIYLSATSSDQGKMNKAMFALVDRFINDNSESTLTLDFEGSNIANIARFYSGFGAKPCTYQRLVINNLPWFLKPFKR